MTSAASAAILILGLLGGSALGAALGGLLAGLAKWRGAALAAALGAASVLGAVAGLVLIGDVRLPDLGAMIAKAGESRQEARLMAVLKAHYPDDYPLVTRRLAEL